MLNLRKTPSFIEKEVKNSDNAFVGWAKIILPPFVVYLIICVISLFSKIAQKIKGSLRKPDDFGPGEASK